MGRALSCLALLAAVSVTACGGGGAGKPDGAPARDAAADASADAPAAIRFATELRTPDDFAAMSAAGTSEVKYLAPVAGQILPPFTAPCYFQNTRLYSWHLLFLQSFPEHAALTFDGYRAMVLRASSRKLWGGTVKVWPGATHPGTGAAGVVSYSVYGDAGSLDAAAIREVDRTLKSCLPFARELLVFVPETPEQSGMLMRERAALAADGVASLFPEDLVAGNTHVAHSAGEAYGTLRIVPRGQALRDYGPRDVVVVESAPNDISLVAAMITRNVQNELGHVNLRLREKRVPNVTVPGIYEAAWVRALDGYLVRLVVTRDQLTLGPATATDAQKFWDEHRPRVPAPVADLSVTTLASFKTMRATDAKAYGAKAANLGELTRVLMPPHRNDGFGIPFAHHRDFLRANGLDSAIADMLADPRVRTDARHKRTRLAALRDSIRAGTFPAALSTALEAAVVDAFGAAGRTQRLRFRSSTNVEDLAAFTGAGLYESKTGCLADDLDGDTLGPSACLGANEKAALEAERAARQAELTTHPDRTWLADIIRDLDEDLGEEKPVAGAVRKVWASLWTERAFDEREHYGIDHRLAHMGVAVNPSFVLERASAVAASNLRVDDGPPVYQVNSQVGSESVVRPEDPTAVAELLTFRREGVPPRATQLQFQVRSNRLPAGAQVWPPETLDELATLLFRVHDHFATVVYPHLVPLHLDFEVKHSADGDVVIKQVRPFAAIDP